MLFHTHLIHSFYMNLSLNVVMETIVVTFRMCQNNNNANKDLKTKQFLSCILNTFSFPRDKVEKEAKFEN